MREIGISPRFSRDKFVPLQTKQRYSTRDISGEVFLTLFFRGFVPFLSLADFVSRDKNLQVADLQLLKLCFGELVTATTRKHRIEANFDKPLRRRLQMIMKTDQEVRIAFLAAHNRQPHDSIAEAEALHEMQRVDKINQEQICKILDSKGLVGRDKVGDAVGTFWAVIQHSDVNTQKKYLPLFHEAAQKGDISKEGVAMMEDRINMFEGKPQRYGSQIEEDERGNPRLYQLLDESKVDEWRSEMGMEPLKDYLRKMKIYR